MTMLDLSNHILAVADKVKLPVTNLRLQKVMYFTIRDFLLESKKLHKNNLFKSKFKKDIKFIKNYVYDKPFYAWQYGPVEPSIYFKYNEYGAYPIEDSGKYIQKYKVFDHIIKTLLAYPISRLVSDSHKQPLWKNNKNDIIDNHNHSNKYTIEDIISEN